MKLGSYEAGKLKGIRIIKLSSLPAFQHPGYLINPIKTSGKALITHPKPQHHFIPHSRPTLGPEAAQAVFDVISSGYIAEGSAVEEFEQSFAKYLNIRHAVATNSGTSALHLALLALEVGPGDEVIIPSYVCSALLNAVNYTGATPVLADICPRTFNLEAADVKKRITDRTTAIIVPHLFGLAADLDALLALDVPIIEDCAQAVGAAYAQRPAGTFGAAAVFSFYATKVITTGEGGMVVTNSREIAGRIRDLKIYDQKDNYKIRFNYKMTDIQATLGLNQLQRLDAFIRRRKAIAEQYTRSFKALDLNLPPDDAGHIFFAMCLISIRIHYPGGEPLPAKVSGASDRFICPFIGKFKTRAARCPKKHGKIRYPYPSIHLLPMRKSPG